MGFSRAGAVLCAAVIGLTAARAGPSEAQATKVHACYAPLAGLVYLIAEPGLLQSCLTIAGVQHVPISWDRTGPKGDKGAPGAAGTPGGAGVDGPPGDKGPTGSAGAQGAPGDKGATGDAGPPGAAGTTGDKGPDGDKGVSGEQGATGDTGAPGDKGLAGEPGAAGDKGPIGERGPTGEKGATGDQGPVGDKGATGDKGPVGEKGPDGDKGPAGESGPTGDKGSIGPPGPDGLGLPCDNGCVTTPLIANLAVTDAKLATITAPGRIANSATTATPLGTPVPANRIAQRDASGRFAAGSANTASGIELSSALSLALVSSIWVPAGVMLFRSGAQDPAIASMYLGVNAGSTPTSGVQQTVAVGNAASSAGGNGITAIGYRALASISTANVGVGAHAAGNGAFPSDFHTVLGWRAGFAMSENELARPVRNILIGERAGLNLSTQSNVIALKRGNIAGASTTYIGGVAGAAEGLQTQAFIAGIAGTEVNGVPMLVASSFQLGIAASSARFKENVRDIGVASNAMNALRPVAYRYTASLDGRRATQYGLIAEEVVRVFPSLIAFDDAGAPYTVRYEMLVPLLVHEIQKRRVQLSLLHQQSRAIERRLERLESTVKP